MKYKNLIIFSIILLASTLRLYRLNSYPPLLWDEAALGYNTFSLLKTGKDEFGKILPITLKSFGDYKPALYAYLDLPFVATLGLNEFSTRLLSAVAGILAVYLLYLVIKVHTQNTKLALFSSFLLATNPFHILLSRGAWETNLVSTFFLLALYLLYNKKYILSTILFVLPAYTYQSAKLTSPLLFITTLFIFPRTKITYKIGIFILLFSPILLMNFFGNDSNRFKTVSILSYSQPDKYKNSIIFPETLFKFRNVATRYFNHFSPELLFTRGDWQNARQSPPYAGILLIILLPFFVTGLFKPNHTKFDTFLYFWLFLSPISSSLTKDLVQPVRATSFIIPLIYFSAKGLCLLINNSFIALILIVLVFTNLYYVQDLYFNHMVNKYPREWLLGYKEAVTYGINSNSKDIFFSDYYGQPHIFYAFYSKLNPITYQKQIKLSTNSTDVGTVEKINNWNFTSINFEGYKTKQNTTLILSKEELIRQNLDKTIFIPLGPTINGYANFYGYKN